MLGTVSAFVEVIWHHADAYIITIATNVVHQCESDTTVKTMHP